MAASIPFPLTLAVKRVLDIVCVFFAISLVVWPVTVAVQSLGSIHGPDAWGIDISVYSGFRVDLEAAWRPPGDSAGLRDPVIGGRASLDLDTSSLSAFLLFAAITEFGGLVGLYVLLQARRIFASLLAGASFIPENSGRFRRIGFAVVAWALVNPFLQYFGGRAILREIEVAGIELYPAFEVSGLAIFVGLAMIVIAGIMDEAARLYEDQQLTI